MPRHHLGPKRYPSIKEINSLPDHIQSYIHDLATRADPQGDLRELDELKIQREELILKIEELKQEIQRLKKSE